MSLQAAYAWFIGRGGLTLERYVIYAGLKRSGYIVLRAPGWDGEEEEAGRGDGGKVDGGQVQEGLGVWAWLYKALFQTKIGDPPPLGPLVGRGLYWSYSKRLVLDVRDLTLKVLQMTYTAVLPSYPHTTLLSRPTPQTAPQHLPISAPPSTSTSPPRPSANPPQVPQTSTSPSSMPASTPSQRSQSSLTCWNARRIPLRLKTPRERCIRN